MASKGKLEHLGCLSCLLRSRDVSFNTLRRGHRMDDLPVGLRRREEHLQRLEGQLGHWDILMSRGYSRIGLGVPTAAAARRRTRPASSSAADGPAPGPRPRARARRPGPTAAPVS